MNFQIHKKKTGDSIFDRPILKLSKLLLIFLSSNDIFKNVFL